MGIIWSLLCMKHREVLTTGKFFPGSPPTTPNQIDELRQRLRDFGDSPEEAAAYARLFDLIVAFIERHQGCELQTEQGLGLLDNRRARVVYSWIKYSMFEDGPLNEAVHGKGKPIIDVVLRREIVEGRIREYEGRGYEDKAKLLDVHGHLDVLDYMKMQSLHSWATSAEKTCTNCGKRMPVIFGDCPKCGEEQYWLP